MTNSKKNRRRTSWAMCLVALMTAGCLDDDDKQSCRTQADCLDGYHCRDQLCESGAGGRDGGVSFDDGGDDSGDGEGGGGEFEQFGTVEPISPASWGIGIVENSSVLAGLTSAAGGLGCTLLAAEDASPGTSAALAYAKLQTEGGDPRCPPGVHAILDDAELCGREDFGGLRERCALYERWDASGEQVAKRLATGGYVIVTADQQSDTEIVCGVELSLVFPGVTIARTYSITYDPLGTESIFCAH